MPLGGAIVGVGASTPPRCSGIGVEQVPVPVTAPYFRDALTTHRQLTPLAPAVYNAHGVYRWIFPDTPRGGHRHSINVRPGVHLREIRNAATAYLRVAHIYMLISMPTGTSTIFGVFQAIWPSF